MTDTDTRPILERARAAMPGLAAIGEALAGVQSRQAAAGARATSESDVANAAAAEAVVTCVVPDNLGERLVEQRRQNEQVHAEIEALRRIQERLETEERDRHRDRADDGLAVLAAELAVIVDAGRAALDALGSDVRDADAAVDLDRVDEWRQARALAERHREARLAQRVIVSAAVSPPRQGRIADDVTPEAAVLVDLFGTVRNPARYTDVAAHAKIAAQGPDAQRWAPGLVSGRPEPRNQPAPPPWLHADPIKVLRFITRPDVEPWVPGLAQLRGVQDQAKRRSTDDDERQPMTDAEIATSWRERGELSPRARGLLGFRHV